VSWAGWPAPGRAENPVIGTENVPGSYIVFSQGFDDETPGAIPNGWTFNSSNGQFYVDNSVDYLGNGNSAKFIDNSTTGSLDAQRYFAEQTGIFAASFSILLMNNTGIYTGVEVRVDDGNGSGANIVFGNGTIQYRDQYDNLVDLRCSYVANRWYRIKILLNVRENVYNIYVDDHLEATDINFTGTGAQQISRIIIGETVSPTPGSLMPAGNIDDIEVRRCIVIPFDYQTIQEGIDVAGPGDIVFVTKQQRYFENLVIAQDNLTLAGEDPSTTIIDGRFLMAEPDLISVLNCSGVSISGFTLALASSGGSQISIVSCNNVTVSNNIIASGLGDGIDVTGSNDTITGNTIKSNLGIGISISGENDSVSGNTIDSNDKCGILFNCENSDITSNVVQSSLGEGIKITSSSEDFVVNNTIRDNQIGLSCDSDTSHITIYQNRFVGNGIQAVDNGHRNRWDYGYPHEPAGKKQGGGGNYWSDYNTSIDIYSGALQDEQFDLQYSAPDGICDRPYNITPNGVDYYPLYPIQEVTQYPDVGSIYYTTNVIVTATMLHLVHILGAEMFVNYARPGISDTTTILPIPMYMGSDDNWSGVIPHMPYGTKVSYFIMVQAESASPLNSTYYPLKGPYTVGDNTPPTLPTPPRTVPTGPDANQTITVYADVTEPLEASQVARVLLSYEFENNTWWTPMNMVADSISTQLNTNTSTWAGTFPKQPGNTVLNFNVTAFNVAGNNASEPSSTFVKTLSQLSVEYNNHDTAGDPGIIDFGTMARKKTSSYVFYLANLGQDTLDWSIATLNGDNWLSVYPTHGETLGGQTTPITITVDTTYCPNPLLYAGELAINANGTVSQWAVVVTLTIRYIIIDESWASVNAYNRVDVGTPETVAFYAEWAENCSEASGGSITINSVPPSTTNSTGWATFPVNSLNPQQITFNVTAVNFDGITDFRQDAISPTIVWDRIKVTLTIPNSWIDVGSNATVYWTAEHEVDNSAFKGQVFLNDTTVHNSVGKWALTVSSIIDSQYLSLTGFDCNVVSCIWDRIEIISAGVSASQVKVNQSATVWFIAIYSYTNTVFKGWNGALHMNGTATLTYDPDTEVWKGEPRYSTAGTRAFAVTGVGDLVHGLTEIKDDVGPQKITWGPSIPWWLQWSKSSDAPDSSDSPSSQASNSQTAQDQNPTIKQAQPSQENSVELLAIILGAEVLILSLIFGLMAKQKKPVRKDSHQPREQYPREDTRDDT